jgi:hypothetical protein
VHSFLKAGSEFVGGRSREMMDVGDTECAEVLLAQDEREEIGRGLGDMIARRT